jgi:hypothetical protein
METTPPLPPEPGANRRVRAVELGRLLHHRYSRLFWTLHSIWALISGVAVLVLAHNRYGFLPWVVLFLALTWISTLVFSRLAAADDTGRRRFARGVVSYLTRIMYQETLFFLLPFYFYTTTFPSWNCGWVILLATLAVLSCYDVLFDRLLRTSRTFALAFFAIVTYSALQFFLPLVLHVRVHNGIYLAAGLAYFASIPLAFTGSELNRGRRLAGIGLGIVLIVVFLKYARVLLPPVPLRMQGMSFGTGIDARTLELANEFEDSIAVSALQGKRLVARATIFAPTRLPTSIQLRFVYKGHLLRESRTLELIAQRHGFRVWDALRGRVGGFEPGRYTVEAWTGEGQLLGRSSLRVVPDNQAPPKGR